MTADKCPCGDVIYANTEDWDTPLCYECYVEMNAKLKPCPFCGSNPCLPPYSNIIICRGCSAIIADKTESGAIKAWNTRHHPSCRDCTFDDGTYCAVLEIKTPSRFVEVDYSDFYCAKFFRRDDG